MAESDSLRAGSAAVQLDWRLSQGRAPTWLHWGRAFDGALHALRDPLPPATLDNDPRLDLCPLEGNGWMHQSAMEGYRPGPQGNRDWSPVWSEAQVRQTETQITVTLAALDAGLRWEQHWTLAASGSLWTISTSLVNTGDTPYQLSWLASATLPLPVHADRALTLGGPWAGEFKEQWDTLPQSMFRRDNRRGRSSHDCFPGVIVGGAQLGEESGDGWGVHLGFSGSHRTLIEPLTDGRRQLQIGELFHGGALLLQAGERYDAPAAYAAFSAAGLAGLSAAFHAVLRDQILCWPAPRKPRPVHLNTWEALYFNHDPDRLLALAQAAAQVGVERFVLDDGWFRGRAHDRAGLGDWWPDAGKYPLGLEPLAAQVISLGMEFGLWVEPEMVNPGSELYRAHPDWALSTAGAALRLGRNQLVLDLTLPEVVDYLFDKLDHLLSTIPISYLKWDMNRDLGPAGSDGRAVHGQQVRALYALLARVRRAHPGVEIESCASGGGRADFGILAYTHRLWTSDCNDPLERITIQRGFLRFFPPELMGAHIGPSPAHTTGRQHRLDFRAAVALCGHCGVEADVSTMEPSEKLRLSAWLAQYKRLRARCEGAAVHQGALADGINYVGYWNAAQGRGIVWVFRVAAARQRYPSPLPLPWLGHLPSVLVRAAAVNDTPLPAGWESLAEGTSMSGAALAVGGLPLPPMLPESAWLVELEQG